MFWPIISIFLLSSVYPVWQTLACAAHLVLAASGANRPFFLFSFFQKSFPSQTFPFQGVQISVIICIDSFSSFVGLFFAAYLTVLSLFVCF